MTVAEIASIVPNEAQAKCLKCGHNWKLERGDAFLCPYCHFVPEEIKVGYRYVEFQL